MGDSTQQLWEMYSPEEKNNFFHAYVYLKYIDHFIHHAFAASGLPKKERTEFPEESIDEMLKMAVQEIGEVAGGYETDIYHGKVVNLKDAIQLVTQKVDLSLITPERVIPFKVAKDIILKNPESIAVGECACRSASLNPCLPMDVCLFVGDPVASFIAEHNTKYRKISQEEAVGILNAEHKRGHVHCAYFKREMGNRFFCVCNCCSCCCLGVQMWNLLGGTVPLLASSGYVAEVGGQCNGCSDCVASCNFKAIAIDENSQRATVDHNKCMGCGVCEDMCPVEAISLVADPSKGEPLDLSALLKQTH
jgi:NAD-dependent dihydropyrimidine dehydrogenase PreA subunit